MTSTARIITVLDLWVVMYEDSAFCGPTVLTLCVRRRKMEFSLRRPLGVLV
jgi:hypothetical protein